MRTADAAQPRRDVAGLTQSCPRSAKRTELSLPVQVIVANTNVGILLRGLYSNFAALKVRGGGVAWMTSG